MKLLKAEAAPTDAPEAESTVVEPRPEAPAPADSAPMEPLKISIPRLALAVLTKQVGKRQAFALAKAEYGPDGTDELKREISAARRRWLPIPGTIRKTSDGREYAVDKNGAMRRVSSLVDAARKVAA